MASKALKYAGVTIGLLLVASVGASVRAAGRDRRAGDFRKLLRETIVAGSVGGLANTAFNPHYRKSLTAQRGKVLRSLPQKKAEDYADEINGALKWYNDDEDAIHAVFAKLTNKLKVSQVAAAFLDRHKAELLPKLIDRLSDAEFTRIKNRIKSLPDH